MLPVKIRQLKSKTQRFRDAKRASWIKVHKEQYGVEYDRPYWTLKPLILEAKVKTEFAGALIADLMAGVVHIHELIVKEEFRGEGVGGQLMTEVEKWAKENKAHMLILDTGVNWKARKFYNKLGFKTIATIPRYYSKLDFVVMSKNI